MQNLTPLALSSAEKSVTVQTNKYVRLWDSRIYPHMPILRPHATRFHERRISSLTFTSAHFYGNVHCSHPGKHMALALADSSDFGLLGSGGAKFTKISHSLPWTPMNRRAKFDATSFIIGGEIRNRTNKQTNTQTHKQTVNNIFIPCLSACMDKN